MAERRASPNRPIATSRQSAASAVDLAKHGVEGADHDHEVGDEIAGSDALEGLEIVHAGRARAHAVRLVLSVAHDVIAKLAARRLDGMIHVARWDAKAFADQLEVMDQRLHRERDRLFGR